MNVYLDLAVFRVFNKCRNNMLARLELQRLEVACRFVLRERKGITGITVKDRRFEGDRFGPTTQTSDNCDRLSFCDADVVGQWANEAVSVGIL